MKEHGEFGFGRAGDARDVAGRRVKHGVIFLPRRGAGLQADLGLGFVPEPIGAAGLLDHLRGERGVAGNHEGAVGGFETISEGVSHVPCGTPNAFTVTWASR